MFLKVIFLFSYVLVSEAQFEGEGCIKDGVGGVCTNLNRCQSAINDIKHRKNPQICSFNNKDPVVCCFDPNTTVNPPVATTTSRPVVTSTNEYIPPFYDYETADQIDGQCAPIPETLTTKKTGQKALDNCIEYQEKYVYPCEKRVAPGDLSRSNRCPHNADEMIFIHGRLDAAQFEFPHMVMVGYGEKLEDVQYLCGGALISDKFVLTAGHCIAHRHLGPVTYIVVGAFNRNDSSDRSKVYKVKNIIKHPEYKPPAKYNDIALIETEQTIALDHFTVPACLPIGDPAFGSEKRVQATGWGLTRYNGAVSNTLQKVTLYKFSTSECQQKNVMPINLMNQGFNAKSQTCYGDKEVSNDTCLVMVGYGEKLEDVQYLCGGALISDKFVLTAGHCIAHRHLGPVTYIVVGAFNRNDSSDRSKVYKVKNIIKHPEYKPPAKYNDIALIETEQTIALDHFTVPACLPIGDPAFGSEKRVQATGWGLTRYNGAVSNTLQKVTLYKFSTSECQQKNVMPINLMNQGFNAKSQTCYGDKEVSNDTCLGDSGDPIQIKNKKINCMYTVVGVTSFGKVCGFSEKPGIYTRVLNYVPWIEDIVWPN